MEGDNYGNMRGKAVSVCRDVLMQTFLDTVADVSIPLQTFWLSLRTVSLPYGHFDCRCVRFDYTCTHSGNRCRRFDYRCGRFGYRCRQVVCKRSSTVPILVLLRNIDGEFL